jgi:hypothetical protein
MVSTEGRMMNHPEREALLKEGKAIVERTDADSWRLAEIVHELHEGGMTYPAISEKLGWKSRTTAEAYGKAHDVPGHPKFADAFVYARMSDTRQTAVAAVADANDISPKTANARAEVKQIVAEIADLPDDEKREVAREMAQDETLRNEIVGEAKRQNSKKKKDKRRDKGPKKEQKTGLETARAVVICESIESDFNDLLSVVDGDEPEEVKKLICEYVEAFALQGQVVLTTMGTSENWSEALKEIV